MADSLSNPSASRKACVALEFTHFLAPVDDTGTPTARKMALHADACAPFGFGFAESSLRSKLLRRISPLRENSMRKIIPRVNRRGDRLTCIKKSAFSLMHSLEALAQAQPNTRKENAPSWAHLHLHAVRLLKQC